MNKRLRLTLVGLFFALMFFYVGVEGYFVTSYFGSSSDPGWQVGTDGRVLLHGSASGADVSALRDGDEIVALKGQEYKHQGDYLKAFERVPPSTPYTIVVRRNGLTEELTLRTAPYRPWMWFNVVSIRLITPATFLLMGLAFFLLKPDDKRMLILVLMLGMFWASGPPASLMLADLPGWLVWVLIPTHLIGACFFPVILHFFLIFPEPSPLLRRVPRLPYYLYALYLLAAYPSVAILAFQMATEPRQLAEPYREFPSLFAAHFIVSWLYVLGGLLLLVVSYRKANELSRRKLRVVLVGMTAGFFPLGLVNAALFFFNPSISLFWVLLVGIAYLMLLLIPLSFAYAILRHQVIPVSLMIRRSVQYLLAKNALRALLVLPVAGLAAAVISNPNRTLGEILFRNSVYFYLLALAAIALGLLYRRRLNEWVDRKFFREHYNQEKILRELVDEVKRSETLTEASRLVSSKVESALHPERLYLFYRAGERGDLSLSYTSGGSSDELRVPESFQLLRFAELQGGAQDFPFPPKTNLPQGEKDWLASLGARLIVPLTGTDSRLAGLFILGDKKSEVPYTARDRELLEAVAAQVALVYENLRLKDRVEQDRKERRQVLSRFEGRNINLLKECPVCGACYDGTREVCERDGAELRLTLPVERTIEGRYRLERLIGRGGMGAVYEASDTRLGRKVAVKILGAAMFGDATALRRFKREAQSAARLSHPNIITIHDYGELQTEGAFLVMDYARGESLGAILKRERRIEPRRASLLFEQILEGLKAAHAAGVVHRDLKPDNILVSETSANTSHVRILDFGLAKVRNLNLVDSLQPTAAIITAPGLVIGTFGYMSPEQLQGEEADERSDLFSVGVMAFEALAGRRPFKGRTLVELLHSMQHDAAELPGETQEARRLNEVLRKCLAWRRDGRFADAAEMQRELIHAMRDYALEAPPLDAETAILHNVSSRPSKQ